MALDPVVKKMLSEVPIAATPEEILRESLDMSTIQACAAVVVSMGFAHFEKSKDTRVDLEARKAHKFVSLNCEVAARKIIQMTGMSETDAEEILKGIMAQTAKFREQAQGKKS